MGMGLSMSICFEMVQTQTTDQHVTVTDYSKRALKAFKRVQIDGRYYYTCNVARLREAERLGRVPDICLYRTHFFLLSPHFQDVVGVIFSEAPGQDLAMISRLAADSLYVVFDRFKLVNPYTGEIIVLSRRLTFASLNDDE